MSLQGAGVAVLYLDVYGGFARYGLVGADVAVVLLAAVAALGLALAVWQEAEPLGVLALLGALAAPALVGDAQDAGSGLLVYLALVQIAVLGLGLVRRWRGVVLVGFLGTLALTTRYVLDGYTTGDYLLAQAFLVVLLAVYLTLGVRLGLASTDDGAGRASSTGVDATLVVGLPVALVVLAGPRGRAPRVDGRRRVPGGARRGLPARRPRRGPAGSAAGCSSTCCSPSG